MTLINRITLINDLFKKKNEEEEEPFKIAKIKPLSQVGLGISAKATGGITLPGATSIKPLIEGLPMSPISEIESVTGFNPEVGAKETKELASLLQGAANAKKQLNIQWSKEYEESTDKKSFLKGIGQSPELKKLWKDDFEWDKTLSENNINISDWVKTGVYAAYFAFLAADILPILSQLPANILNNLAYKVENKTVKGQELKDILWKVAYSKTTEFERKVFDKFVSGGGLSGIGGNLQKGISITETVPRFAFGAKLYAGLPADEIAKSIIEVGKVTAEAVKGLDPIKVSQVAQQLMNTPILLNEFLKAVEKPEAIPKVKPEPAKVTPPVEPKEVLKAEGKEPIIPKKLESLAEETKKYKTEEEFEKAIYNNELKSVPKSPAPYNQMSNVVELTKSAGFKSIEDFYKQVSKIEPKTPTKVELPEKQIIPATITEAKEILKVDPKKPSQPKELLAKQMVANKVSLADIEAVKGEKIDVKEPKDILIALRDIKAVKKEVTAEPTLKAKGKAEIGIQKGIIGWTQSISEKIDSIPDDKVIELYDKLSISLTNISNKEDISIRLKSPTQQARFTEIQGELEKEYNYLNTVLDEYGINKNQLPDFSKALRERYNLIKPTKGKTEAIVKPAEVATEKPAVTEAPAPEIKLATPEQIKKIDTLANSKAMISENGKVKPQFRALAKAMTDQTLVKKMTENEAEIFIDALNRLPEPRLNTKTGELIPPSIPRTTKLVLQDFFKRQYKEPTPLRYLTPQTYYAEILGVKPLVEPFEIGKQEFDLEFRETSKTTTLIIDKLNKIAKTSAGEKFKSKLKNIPTKAESNMAELVNKYEEAPASLPQGEKDVFNYFRSLSRDLIDRENEVRESVDLPPIKYKKAYFKHTADGMAKEILEGKYPFPQGLKYWSEKIVGKKIFNPMEFQRKLSDGLLDLWSKDLRAVTKSMLWYGLKEIHLAQPAKFLNEQLGAISKDLPIYKHLSPEEQKAYDETRVIPASTKKWLLDYINQVIKGQETEGDASLNRIVTQSGLKGLFNKVLSPFGRTVGRKPITNLFSFGGRITISGVMGWVPRQIIRNTFQQVQNLALYGVKATLKSFLPVSVDKNLKELLTDSLFMKSYTGFEELPTNLMGKLEKIWLAPYGFTAIWNAGQGMKAAYWNTLELIKNPKFKDFGWSDPQRTKDTPRGFLYPSEKEKLLKEMEFGSGCTQYLFH